MSHHSPWTQEEIDTLRRVYPTEGRAAAAAACKRTLSAVKAKVGELGISVTGDRLSRSRSGAASVSWSDEDAQTLRDIYPEHGAKAVADLVNRSPGAVQRQARRMGVKVSAARRSRVNTAASRMKKGKRDKFTTPMPRATLPVDQVLSEFRAASPAERAFLILKYEALARGIAR